jgi:hypothetical protein
LNPFLLTGETTMPSRLLIPILVLATCLPAQAQEQASSSLTFLDSRLFDGALSRELAKDKETVEVEVSGKMSLNAIPQRLDQWITTVGESGELTLKATEPPLKPKFVAALIPVVYNVIKQIHADRTFDPARKYNATVLYSVNREGESVINKIVFSRKPK